MTDQPSPNPNDESGRMTAELMEHINRWRSKNVEDYWVKISYLGSELNRFGDHDLTFVEGKLWHFWRDDWREIKTGSDFWLFSVPGGFAWARDIITKVLPDRAEAADALRVEYDDEYGYVKLLQFEAGHRDPTNFTFEVKRFGEGPHDSFE